ncbi:ABC transporter substrate-binding protein [Tepidimonas alkaliphilus]|uniref:ABC transporter substrate-binding protein n=1 Tax=Tepidimonas alkaliphilus TaxID=2588942 RepID=UPI00163DB7EF|nr:ABC transporter substrate-binding protein [Tepidimonas alkaliphilus]
MSRRRFLLGGGAAALLAGCPRSVPRWRIGILNTFSGPNADAGLAQRHAAWMALQDLPPPQPEVEWLEYDDQDDLSSLPALAARIAQEQPVALLGPATSTLALHWLPWAEELKLLTMSATATAEVLGHRDDWFFRTCSSTRADALQAARFAALQPRPAKRVCIVRSDRNPVFAESWETHFRADYLSHHPRADVCTLAYHAHQGLRLQQLPDRIEQLRPELIVLVTPSIDAAYLAQQRLKRRWSAQLMVTDWVSPEVLLQWGGRGAEGVWLVGDFDPGHPGERYRQFRERFLRIYRREPMANDVRSYDAAFTLLSALRAQRPAESLKNTLLRLQTFEGLQSMIRFDAFGDCQRPMVLCTIAEGALRRLA